MKKCFTYLFTAIVVVLLSNLTISDSAYAQQYSYWPFDETSGTTATDVWNNRVITLNTTATFTTGKTNNGLHFDGTSTSYATLPTGVVSTLNDFTIATWVKLDAILNWSRILDFGSNTTSYMYLAPQMGATPYKMRFAITTSSNGGEQYINTTHTFTAGTWTHVAVTLSGGIGIVYVNGVEVGRNSAMTLKPSSLGNTTQNYLGKSQWNDPLAKGTLDDFRIYSTALTQTEISALANTVLPLKLLSFKANFAKSAINIDWSTSDEKNVSKFVLERSYDGSVFYPINAVGAENKQSDSNYSLTDDLNLLGYKTQYYRLKMIDLDGGSTESEVVAVKLPELSISTKLAVYPNPASEGRITIIHPEAVAGATIKVISLNGSLISQQNVSTKSNSTSLNVDGLAVGIYMLKFDNGKLTESIRFVKN